MPRRKPTSTKQLKADRQLKRAVKRGDAPPLTKKSRRTRKGNSNRTGQVSESTQNAIESSRKLQSTFINLPPTFLEDTKLLASSLALPRPITQEAVLLTKSKTGGEADVLLGQLSCPRRPKWRFDMSKTEVEKNEEGLHRQWIVQMDKIVQDWQKGPVDHQESQDGDEEDENKPRNVLQMPRSPTYFERNLEVWRQLWRVTEISQVILVLLDSRCPLLHFPPSLSTYLSDRKVILVLTKVDISGPTRAASWTHYFNTHHPNLPVVQVEAYAEKTASAQHQGRTMYEPHLPESFRARLLQAIKKVHSEMMEPPDRIKGNEEKMKRWKPPVKKDIDWEGVMKAGGGQVGSVASGVAVPKPEKVDEEGDEMSEAGTEQEPEFLTVGLIGQPNVGKSSLLNALFGTHKVRASKTPGKTKHFQTLCLGDVRLVDCPGLVVPNFVPMEMQVLSGILPISRVSAIPACIHFVCQYLPLERIYGLTHPSLAAPPVEDKRTWRDGVKPSAAKEKGALTWTAMDVLTAYAVKKGWVTAKAGRPDVGRAGNSILRAVAESRVRWAFWPPDMDISSIQGEPGDGIWIPEVVDVDDNTEPESEEDESEPSAHSRGTSEFEPQSESEEEVGVEVAGVGRFGALVLDHDSTGDGEDQDSDDEEARS